MNAADVNLYLVGFMGTGKSTVGRAVAQKLGFALLKRRDDLRLWRVAGERRLRRPPIDDPIKLLRLKRLRQTIVHPGAETALAILRRCISGQRDNRNMGAAQLLSRPNGSGSR